MRSTLITAGLLSTALLAAPLLSLTASPATSHSIWQDSETSPVKLRRLLLGPYRYQAKGSDFTAQYKGDPTTPAAVKAEFGESWLAFYTLPTQSFATASPTPPQTQGSALTYPALFPATDLRYTTSTNRVLEEFIIHDRETAATMTDLTQIIEYHELDWQLIEGQILFTKEGAPVARAPVPVMYELHNRQEESFDLAYELTPLPDQQLSVTKRLSPAGLAWLTDPSRQYPVVIDLVIDNADTAANWVSSDSTLLSVAQETTIKQEGTGSVKLTPTTSWYDYAWPYRLKLTIDSTKVAADLTDYPVYVDLSTLPSGFHSHVNQTDGRDIRVTKGDGTTELPREVVFYNSTSDTGELHFQYTGTLSGSSNTDVYLYYGNTGASDYANTATYGRDNTWNSNYQAVWHLQESSGTHYDSSGNGNNSTTVSVATQGTANAKLGGADDFDATTSYINFGSGSSLDLEVNASFEAWIYPDGWGENGLGYIMARGPGSGAGYSYYTRSASTSLAFYDGSGNAVLSNTISSGAWSYAVAEVANDVVTFYVNGSNYGPTSAYTLDFLASTDVYLGNRAANDRTFDGQLDEIRISSVARGINWYSTQYNNHNSPATFFSTIGGETSIVGQTATLTTSATDLSSYDQLTYYVRSDRTGSFMRFQFGEAASGEQTNSITINSANTWEQKTWNISGITATARDAVTKYAFYTTDASANFAFYFDDIQASVSNSPPNTASLDAPTDTATNQALTPALKTTTTDPDSDYLRYKIELCENVGMSTNCQTFDQTVSQTGWSGQNAETSTAYTSGTQATYTIQSALSAATTYYWRSYAIDPGGTNSWSSTQGTPYSFTTSTKPATPSLDSPSNTAIEQSLTPALKTTTTDPDSDYLRYKIELCENVGMSTNCQTFDQTVSQTGWSGQNAETSTAYTSGTQATYTIQSALSAATTYYWRSYAIDPGGTNSWSSTQGTPYRFTTTIVPGTTNLYLEGLSLSGLKLD